MGEIKDRWDGPRNEVRYCSYIAVQSLESATRCVPNSLCHGRPCPISSFITLLQPLTSNGSQNSVQDICQCFEKAKQEGLFRSLPCDSTSGRLDD